MCSVLRISYTEFLFREWCVRCDCFKGKELFCVETGLEEVYGKKTSNYIKVSCLESGGEEMYCLA